MKEHYLLVNKKPRKVKLPETPRKKTFKAEVNDKPTKIKLPEDIRFDDPFFINVDGKPYKIQLERNNVSASITVKVDGISHLVQIENKNRATSQVLKPTLPTMQRKPTKTSALDKNTIAATMPGKVVLLRVELGDSVSAGDVLLVLESMKMENEIVSPISGTVKELKVSEGEAVNIGQIMVVIGNS